MQIADALTAAVETERGGLIDGLMVICDAKHMCMVARGVEKAASSTSTFAARGCLEEDAQLRVRKRPDMYKAPLHLGGGSPLRRIAWTSTKRLGSKHHLSGG